MYLHNNFVNKGTNSFKTRNKNRIRYNKLARKYPKDIKNVNG